MAPARQIPLRVAVLGPARILLDTCVLLDAYNEKWDLVQVPRPKRTACLVSYWEFLRRKEGPLSAGEIDRRIHWLDAQGVRTVGFRKESQPMFEALAKSGRPTHLPDALIALEALSRRWPLLTWNLRDFIAVPNLTLATK